MAIVVLSIAVTGIMSLLSYVTHRFSFSEEIAGSIFYGQQLMEEIRSKRYDEQTAADNPPPWTDSANFGPDTSTTGLDGTTNENSTDHNNWDDVDDYDGYSQAVPGYTITVSVAYARLNGTNWETTGASVACQNIEGTCAAFTRCCYKQVTVTVEKNNGFSGPVDLKLLVSSRCIN